jgi:glycosyltransferase involved in cell wall biosynthesis
MGPGRSTDVLIHSSLAPLFWQAERIGALSAWWAHVPFAHWLVHETEPRVLVELGVHAGVSYSAFCQAVRLGGLATSCYGVDTWRGDGHTGAYGEEIYEEFCRYHNEQFGAFSTLLRCTFDEALNRIHDGSVDILHIDGFHAFEAVHHDFHSWLPKLSDRAVVLLHDTNERRDDFAVWRLWEALREQHPSFEFLHGHGLGVLAVGNTPPQTMIDLCGLSDPADVAAVRCCFATLGNRWLYETELKTLETDYGRHREAAASHVRELRELLEQVRDQAELAKEEARAEVQRAHTEAELAKEEARVEAQRAHAEAELAKEEARVEAQRARSETQRAVEAVRLDAANRVQRTAADNHRLAEAAQVAERRADTAQAEARAAAARASAIEHSTVWRATRPLRRFLERFPGLLRGSRLALRIGWWTVSLQLRRRLHERREILAQARAVGASSLFDRGWYLHRYADIAAANVDPALHYVTQGAAESRQPGPQFDAAWYLSANPDVAVSRTNPLLHYIDYGMAEGRDPNPHQPLIRAILASGYFDREWYMREYPDVADAGVDPAWHYVTQGAAELRSPGPQFDAAWYLSTYPDVAASGTNPLLHYIQYGMAEGRERHGESYAQWVRDYDTLDDTDRTEIRAHVTELSYRPLISVVVPVHNTEERYLRAMIESVLQQLYPYWELCLADDASTEPRVRRVLLELARRDARIKVVRRQTNGHISAATNSALDLATGEFVALLDHDDLLAECALYEVAVELAAHPDADVLYSDSDHIDDSGRRWGPYFKTDWDPDLALGHNMINHLAVYRRSLLERIGRLREGFEGAQDYDLILRASEGTVPTRIRHIPAVLYHWRRNGMTPSFSESSLERCVVSARRAIRGHLKRSRIPAHVEHAPGTRSFTRVVYALPDERPLVSVIVPTRDQLELLADCVDGVLTRTDYDPLELIIVDNDSEDPESRRLLSDLAKNQRVRVMRHPGAFNFASMINQAVRAARGEVVALLNNDVNVISPAWLEEMVSHAIRPGVGAVGAKLLYPDGRVQHAGIALGVSQTAGHFFHQSPRDDPGRFGFLALTRQVSAVTAACMALRRSVYLEVGGMDEVNLPIVFNDVDLCLRLGERGYRVIWTPHAELYHRESATRGLDERGECSARLERDAESLRRRWGAKLNSDPHYNPNCSLGAAQFEPAFPPRRQKPWQRFKDQTDTGSSQ